MNVSADASRHWPGQSEFGGKAFCVVASAPVESAEPEVGCEVALDGVLVEPTDG